MIRIRENCIFLYSDIFLYSRIFYTKNYFLLTAKNESAYYLKFFKNIASSRTNTLKIEACFIPYYVM